ncbi:MAG: hypothetical protein ACXVBW_01585 [Bdellovibrionota bacterium]
MFFRRGLILLALGLVASSGCREKVASSVAADSGPGCLAGATDTVRAFLTGTDTSHRMPGVFDCIQQSLDMFEAKAVGANPDSFSLQELRNVLQTFFVRPDQFKISDELIGEVKTLKRSLFGDHQDSFTKKELAQIRKILAVLKQGAIDLGPYMPLTPGHVGHLKREEFKLALGALANFASNLAAQINPSDEPYSFSHLDHLLAIFTRDGNIEPKESLLQSLRERIPLARAFKIAFLDPNPDLITSDNRRDFVQFAQAWFRVLLKMGYLGEHYPSWNHG